MQRYITHSFLSVLPEGGREYSRGVRRWNEEHGVSN